MSDITFEFSTFNAANCLPVEISSDAMELIFPKLEEICFQNSPQSAERCSLMLEIGECRPSTPDFVVTLLDDTFSGLLDIAFDSECTYIHFYY